MAKEHYLDDSVVVHTWNNAHPPRLRIAPGDTVVFECREASGAQIGPGSTAQELADLDLDRADPITGPVYVEGAQPGDTLRVEVRGFEHKGWGWSGIIPGFGLLPDDFPHPYLHIWQLEGDLVTFRDEIAIPVAPFCGEMGVAPRKMGPVSPIVPDEHGGNLDTRHLTVGSVLYLPVWVEGALFCCGDCHAAQGDGEVCGTGIEAPMTATLRFEVIKSRPIAGPRFEARSPLCPADQEGYYAISAMGPDLHENAKTAVREMIGHLTAAYGLTPEEAYILCSVAVDLKISQVVDAPNYTVSAYLPKTIMRH